MEPIDLTNAKPDPNWAQKKELGWVVLARETLAILNVSRETSEDISEAQLAKALEQADRKLTWQEVPNDGRRTNTGGKKFRAGH